MTQKGVFAIFFKAIAHRFYKQHFSDGISRSPCFDWHNFIRTRIKYEILLHVYFIIWTGIIFQVLDFDMLVQKDFGISDIFNITKLV